jgi:hypothetical protein
MKLVLGKSKLSNEDIKKELSVSKEFMVYSKGKVEIIRLASEPLSDPDLFS